MNAIRILRTALRLLIAAALLPLLGGFPARVVAADPPMLQWTGAGGPLWSDARNWMPLNTSHNVPQNGDALVFGGAGSPAVITANNDLNGLSLAGLFAFTDTTLTGKAVTVETKLSSSGAGTAAVFSLPLVINSMVIAQVDTGADLVLNGVISGPGSLMKSGPARLSLNAANSFTGGVEIDAGTLSLDHGQGAGTGEIHARSGATLAVSSGVSLLTNPLVLSGKGVDGLGALTYTGWGLVIDGPIQLISETTIYTGTGSTGLTFRNAITGTGNLILDGPGFTFAGSNANTFTGGLRVTRGRLSLSHPDGVVAVPHALFIGPGDGVTPMGVATYGDNQFDPTSTLVMEKNAFFDLQGHSQTIRIIQTNTGPCRISLDANGVPGSLTLNTVSGDFYTVYCNILGTGKVTVTGKGLQDFAGNDPASPFNGTIEVKDDGSSYLSAFHMTGVYSLGPSSRGGLHDKTQVGSLLADDAQVSIEVTYPVYAPSAGSLLFSGAKTRAVFDLIYPNNALGVRVSGRVDLGGVNAEVYSASANLPGLTEGGSNLKRRTLISNDSGSPVSGTFAGLPEGGQGEISDSSNIALKYPMRITYQGGDGNDVVITRLAKDSLTLFMLPAEPEVGQTVTLQAHFTALEDPGAAVTRKVGFYLDDAPIGEAALSGGNATLSAGPFPLGAHTLQARLVGDPNYADAYSAPIKFRIGEAVYIPSVGK